MSNIGFNPLTGKFDLEGKSNSELLQMQTSFHAFTGIAMADNVWVRLGRIKLIANNKEFICTLQFMRHNTYPYAELKPIRSGTLQIRIAAPWHADRDTDVECMLQQPQNITVDDIKIVQVEKTSTYSYCDVFVKLSDIYDRYFYTYTWNQGDTNILFEVVNNENPDYYLPNGLYFNCILYSSPVIDYIPTNVIDIEKEIPQDIVRGIVWGGGELSLGIEMHSICYWNGFYWVMQNNKILKSSNLGYWEIVFTNTDYDEDPSYGTFTCKNIFVFDYAYQVLIFGCSHDTIIYTVDGVQFNTLHPANNPDFCWYCHTVCNGTLFIANNGTNVSNPNDKLIYKSTDGTSYFPVDIGNICNSAICGIASDKNSTIIAFANYLGMKMLRSFDGGDSFQTTDIYANSNFGAYGGSLNPNIGNQLAYGNEKFILKCSGSPGDLLISEQFDELTYTGSLDGIHCGNPMPNSTYTPIYFIKDRFYLTCNGHLGYYGIATSENGWDWFVYPIMDTNFGSKYNFKALCYNGNSIVSVTTTPVMSSYRFVSVQQDPKNYVTPHNITVKYKTEWDLGLQTTDNRYKIVIPTFGTRLKKYHLHVKSYKIFFSSKEEGISPMIQLYFNSTNIGLPTSYISFTNNTYYKNNVDQIFDWSSIGGLCILPGYSSPMPGTKFTIIIECEWFISDNKKIVIS